MEKAARKTSADPVQEKLRKDKDVWNKQVSQFIENVKQVKKTMNGYPSKLNPQKGNIKNPLPPSVPSTLEALTQAFDNIAQSGESIVEEQLAYSKNRRKNQPKAPVVPAPAPTQAPAEPAAPETPDLSKQLTAWEEKYGLVAEASNPISRFFTKLLNPSFGFGEAARVRRVRMQLLRACADTYKKLGRLQVEIVKSSKSSIDTSNNLMHDVWRNWETVRTGFATYKGMMPARVPDAGGILEEPKEVTEDKEKGNEQAVKSTEKIEQKMEKVDRAVEEGKPEPDDADYEPKSGVSSEERQGPDWVGGRERMIEDLHKQEILDLSRRAGKDFQFALSNFWFMQNHDVDLSIFHELEKYKKEYHIREEWAPVFLDLYYKAVDDLNAQVATKERSFKDIINRLHQRDVFNKKMEEQQRKLELFQKKEQEKKDKLDKKNQLAAQRAQEKAQEEADRARKKSEEDDRKQQERLQKQLEQAQQKALLAKPPAPPSSAASDQLEATAQAFLKKWIGKTRHQMSIFDQTSSQRLQIFEVATEMRTTVNDIMDHLEKDINVDEMAPMIDKANRQLTSIRSLTRNLHNTHRPLPKGKK